MLPEVDPNINKVIKNFRFSPKDLSDFWKIFQKLDKHKTGLVPLTVMYASCSFWWLKLEA